MVVCLCCPAVFFIPICGIPAGCQLCGEKVLLSALRTSFCYILLCL